MYMKALPEKQPAAILQVDAAISTTGNSFSAEQEHIHRAQVELQVRTPYT
jgi:hypothetical protein